jgi:hypothetical protein
MRCGNEVGTLDRELRRGQNMEEGRTSCYISTHGHMNIFVNINVLMYICHGRGPLVCWTNNLSVGIFCCYSKPPLSQWT